MNLRLGTEKILLFKVLFSSPLVLCLFAFVWSAVLPTPFSYQYFVSSECSKLWFRKIVLVFTPSCPFQVGFLCGCQLIRTLTTY